jgi:PAS domain S-box-containing protein
VSADLRESEARFRNMADNTPMMMWVTDPSGLCTYLNRRWYEFTGQSVDEAEGFGWLDATHPDDKARTEDAFVTANAARAPFQVEYRLRRADGVYRWAIDAASPRFDANGEYLGYVGSVVDIDERREMEDALRHTEADLRELNATLEERVEARTHELQAAHEALRQSQKMEAVGQLTGGIAHDFNNLLAGISGSLELLSKRLREGRLNGMERYIDAAQGSAQRAAALTQRLLAFSRRQTLDPKPTDVNRLIAGMEDLIRRTVSPDIEIEVVGAGGLWPTRIDPSQLENALLNLCINARDAMVPDGGRLTIETANKWLDEKSARERDLQAGQYVSLCVTDTGTGMTPEIQAQAFDPFFTTKPLGQGTGLGLSMIHGFVRQSGGQVRIYSEVGKGTTMCLYLPRWMGNADALETATDAPVAEGGHGETVLVIDDEETVRMLVAEVLGEAGYHVIEAPDGPSGLDILRSDRRIDLLVSDVGLPGGMNGRQVADAARVGRPDLKVLFITGYAENAAVGNGLLAPGMEVITKPFVMAELALKVHEMIEG